MPYSLPTHLFAFRLLRGLALLLVLGLMMATRALAQDVIIKNNKEEIKAKVLEIEETTVKYKLFDFQDGPSYTIRKSEVFMIQYHNGRRETFDEAPAPAPAPSAPTRIAAAQAERDAIARTQREAAGLPANEPAKPEKYKHEPWRLLFSHQSSGDAGFEVSTNSYFLNYESNLVSGYLNWGGGFFLSTYSTDGASTYGGDDTSDAAFGTNLFLAGYLPFNRMMGKAEAQHRGFFPFVQLGVAATYVSGSEVDVYYAVGADYKFSDKFGLTLQTWEFNGIGLGVTFGK